MTLTPEMIDILKQCMARDLLPSAEFCALYGYGKTTPYSWKTRYPELVGVVFFEPSGRDMHISISGYEKWIRGELNKNNTQQACGHTEPASKSGSSGQRVAAKKRMRNSTGTVPQLT